MSRHAQSASKLNFKDLRQRDAFLIITVIIIIIFVVLCLTSIIMYINDKNNYKSHSLQLRLFTPN